MQKISEMHEKLCDGMAALKDQNERKVSQKKYCINLEDGVPLMNQQNEVESQSSVMTESESSQSRASGSEDGKEITKENKEEMTKAEKIHRQILKQRQKYDQRSMRRLQYNMLLGKLMDFKKQIKESDFGLKEGVDHNLVSKMNLRTSLQLSLKSFDEESDRRSDDDANKPMNAPFITQGQVPEQDD